MSYNYTGVPNASIPPIMSNMGIPGPIIPGPQGYINPMLSGQPGSSGNAPPPPNTSYNMVIPPGMNDSPLEFNMSKNNPPMPIETNSNNGRQSNDDDDHSSGRGDDGNGRRSNRNRNRNDRRSIGSERSERKDDRRPSKDRDRRDKESRPVDETSNDNLGSANLQSSSSDQSTAAAAVTPNMWSGMMGMGYPMMGMIMDPNIMGMNNYGMMQPPMMPDGAMLPQETLDAAAANMVPAAAVVKEILTFKLCTLIPPPPNAPPSTTRERPPGCRTVFVGGLPENITEEILIEVFERCGEISTLRLSKKNFCHIRFVYENSVDAAIFLSGYRIRIANKMDPPNSGRLHVDYAQARDDQYEWECRQRALQREQRHRERMEEERMRPPSPPPVVHYTDHEAAAICDKIKQDESFTKAAQTLLTWLERGDCNKRNANTFYSMIQSTNAHVRRLLGEKNQYEEELQKAKEIMKGRMQGILIQFGQIERVFSAATHKKVWDHFTKAQRKNIDMWRKQSQEIKTVQLEDIFNERGDEEMDVSDTEDESSSRKRPKMSSTDSMSDEKTQQLKDENDSLRCQLEAYKNEVDIVRSDLKMAVDQKDKQIKMLQQTLKGMQQQLLDSKRKQCEDEGRMKDLQAQLDVCTQNEKSSLNILSSTHVITLDDEPPIIDLDGSKSRSNSPEVEEPSTSVVVTSNQTQINERDAKLIGLISTFLHVHPFGAGLDYIWSYVQKLEPVIKPSEVETLMSKFPKVFVQELSGVGANIERRWQFKGYQQNCTLQGP